MLTPYLDDELAADARHQVEEHLQGCASCGALLDEVMSARERVHSMGRSIVPNTVLMPALEAFRDRAGIGLPRQLDLADIPIPQVIGIAALGEDEATDVSEPLAEVEEPDATMVLTPQLPEEESYIEMLSAPVLEPPHVEAEPFVPVESSGPAFPPLPPDPYAGGYADAYNAAVETHAVETEEPFLATAPPAIAAIPFDAPWSITYDEPAPETEAVAAEPALDLAAAEAAGEAAAAALEERPEAPAPHAQPPWLEAEAADAEDMEASGRLFIEEDLAAETARARHEEAVPVLAPDFTESYVHSGDGVEEAVARMRQELDPGYQLEPGDQPEPDDHVEPENEMVPLRAALAAAVGTPPRDDVATEFREALRTRYERERPSGLAGLDTQVKLGLAAAAAIVLLLVGVLVVPRMLAKPANKVAQTAGRPAPQASAVAAASPAATAATPPAQTATTIPALTGVITGGAGGTGSRWLESAPATRPTASTGWSSTSTPGGPACPTFRWAGARTATSTCRPPGSRWIRRRLRRSPGPAR